MGILLIYLLNSLFEITTYYYNIFYLWIKYNFQRVIILAKLRINDFSWFISTYR